MLRNSIKNDNYVDLCLNKKRKEMDKTLWKGNSKKEPFIILLNNEFTLILSETMSKDERVKEMKSLFGAVPNDYGEEVLEERLMELWKS